MRPIAHSDSDNAPGLVDKSVPGPATMFDNVVVTFEYAVGEPVLTEELPDVFDQVETSGKPDFCVLTAFFG